jgi:anti-anti-sigma factor
LLSCEKLGVTGGKLEVTKRTAGQVEILDLAGEIDLYNVGQIREALDGSAASKILINMAQVSYIDSTGIGLFLGAIPKFRGAGGDLRVAVTLETVRKVFTLTGLYKHIRIFETEAEALESFQSEPAK